MIGTLALAAFGAGAFGLGSAAGFASRGLAGRRTPRGASAPLAASGVKWQRTGVTGVTEAVRLLRWHYPTHDVHTGIRFLDLVTPTGSGGPDATRRCADWTVGAVMIDKRSNQVDRVVLRDDDEHADEKRWVLRRSGLKVAIMSPNVDEDGMRAALAA